MDAANSKMALVALSLGGNLGDVEACFRFAFSKLEAGGFALEKASSLYRTSPVGCEAGAPDFWNAAAIGLWPRSPQELLVLCKAIEAESGRPSNHPRWHSRTLDLDILLFGELELRSPALTIPHPEACSRSFVLQPLAEIAGAWTMPGKGFSVSSLLEALPASSLAIERRPFPL